MKTPVDALTPLGVMVLALLRESDMHPYEMARLLRARHDDRLITVTNGTLYHTVARLQKLGLLDEIGIDRDGNRPERTTYTLTDAGRDTVVAWVRRELPRVDGEKDFRVALAESHNLERDDVRTLLRERRVALVEAHDLHGNGLARARAHGVPAQVLVEIEREEALLAAELRWLDTLLARLDGDELAWGPSAFTDSDRYLAQRKAAQQ